MQACFWMPLVGGMGKVLLAVANRSKIHNRDEFLDYVHNRLPHTPLITVSNHASLLDDPFLMGRICDFKALMTPNVMRWSTGAKEILFNNIVTSYVVTHGKVISIVRGNGVYQEGMRFAIEQLNKGRWVQIFPEAKVTLEPVRLKWGIGRMIAECVNEPIVLPYWHCGMDDVYPTLKPSWLPSWVPRMPRVGKKVTVLFGEPIRYHDVLERCRSEGACEMLTRKALTDVVEESLYKLKVEAEKLHSIHV